jgi:uncharacterized repeat protein (TIGR03803 family)
MKSFFIIIAVVFLAATDATAATFTNLYNFSVNAFNNGSPTDESTNGDGINPVSCIVSGRVIYGTCNAGGLNGNGTVFRVNTDGTDFTNLFNFNVGTYNSQNSTYPDSTGSGPNPGLLQVSNTLYGTTFAGGLYGAGEIFKINTDGSGFAVIHSFDFDDGQQPASGLTLYNNVLYGTTTDGTNVYGTVYGISLTGFGFATVYQFTNWTQAYGGVVAISNNFYGFASYGGAYLKGYVYRVGSSGFADLFDFDGTNGGPSYATPVASGTTLYGTTFGGGTNGYGDIFRINIDGNAFTNLYSFSVANGANTDGAEPYDLSGMVLSGNTLFGTTSTRGSGGQGTVFSIKTDGTGFSVLHSFQYSDGAVPDALALSGGTLYGMASYGINGSYLGNGGVFALILQPVLTIAAGRTNAVLSWNDPTYSLYTAATANGTFTKINGATSPYTNSIAGSQKYFRLE